MLFRRSLLLGVVLGSLALTGFGCKEIDTSRPNMTSLQARGQVKLPTISVNTKPEQTAQPRVRKPEKQPHPEILRLRDVMSSFQKSQSFRANITIGGPDGVKGEIAYNQSKGTFGRLSLKNGFTTEMALLGNRVAIKSGTSTWSEITNTPEAQNISKLFQSIINRGDSQPVYPSKSARYGSAKDDPARGCKMHSVSQYMGNLNSYQPLEICVANGLPLYFSIPSEDGTIEIEYRDIDKPVDIFFPL